VIAELKGEKGAAGGEAAPSSTVDPLADVMKDIQSGKGAPAATRPGGGPRRDAALRRRQVGRDVIAKTIKGSETSIFVGLAAAALATLIGTVLGAFAATTAARRTTSSTGSTACSARSPGCS